MKLYSPTPCVMLNSCIKITFILVCSFQALHVGAQTNFVEARIVTVTNDTVSAIVDNRDWKKNPSKITAKKTSGEMTSYSALDIKAFHLIESNEWYNGAIVTIDKTSLKSPEVLKNINRRGLDTDTVFLKVLVQGKLSLYSLFDEYSRRHFLARKDGKIEELRIEKKRVLVPKEGVVVMDLYKSQLSGFVADCNNQALGALKLDYTEKALMDFVVRYNNCKGGGKQFVTEIEKTQYRFSALLGVHHSTLTYSGGFVSSQKKYDPSIGPVAGLAFELIFPRNRRSWSMYNELIYKSYAMKHINAYSATQLKLATGFRYRLPSSTSKRIFFGASVINALAIKHDSPSTTSDDFREHEQGIAVDAGLVAGRFQYLVRYERANGFSVGPGYSTIFGNLYGTVAFSLTK